MIKLHKGPEPQSLADHAVAWTQVLLDHEINKTQPSETDLNRYNQSDVKKALKQETHSKCAYCESHFEHIDYGDIDHIVPKKKGAAYRFNWANLTIACGKCNTGKGSKEKIIDPYLTDPETVFFFLGPAMLPNPNNASAVITETTLVLNRPWLLEKRMERLKYLHKTISLALQSIDDDVKKVIIEDIKKKRARSTLRIFSYVPIVSQVLS